MNIVLENSSCGSTVMNKNELDDRMFIARLINIYALDLETLRFRYLGKF